MVPIMDVACSPTCSNVLASVAQDGRIELWDLEESYLDPVVCIFHTEEDNNNNTSCSRTTPHHGNHRKQRSNGLEDPMLLTHSHPLYSSSNGNNTNMDDIDSLQASKAVPSVYGEGGDISPLPHKASRTTIIESLSEARAAAAALTTIALCATVPVLAVGTSDGDVLVYKIGGVDCR